MKKIVLGLIFPFIIIGCDNKKELVISDDLENELFSSVYWKNSTNNYDYFVETYIDSSIQKVANDNLMANMNKYNSEMGYVFIMETSTGKIRAISCFEKNTNNKLSNSSKLHINDAIEPGGLIKTFNLMALLEDKKADTTSIFNSTNGEVSFYGRLIKDSNPETKRLTLSEAYINSSNTIFAQLINNSYQNEPRKFVDNFEKFGLNYSFKLPCPEGNFKTFVPKPNSIEWSKITLPWMSIGYGIRLTPIKLLSYYNTIANNGKMMQPLFISKITSKKGLKKEYKEKVIRHNQISKNTIFILQDLLKKTVNNGIAKEANSSKVSISGYAANTNVNYSGESNNLQYSSSFIGYFPSDKPKYTIMVYLENQNSVENTIVCNIVKEIASKIN
jgi:cell division protein FtsI (penicillin-binding protein 3)